MRASILAAGPALCLSLCLLLRSGQPQPTVPTREQQPARLASMELMERAQKIQAHVAPPTLDSLYASRSGVGVLSPDGKWRLWAGKEQRLARATDGSRVVRRRAQSRFWAFASDNTIWLPGSRRWVTLMAGDRSLYAVVEGLDGANREVPIGNPRCTISWPDLMPSTLLGLVRSRLLAKASRDYYEGDTRMPFYSFGISGGPPRVREFSIAWPRGASDWDEVALSPRGDLLAWLFYFRRSQGPNDYRIGEVRLMLSRPDGSRMRTVARLLVAPSVAADRLLTHYSNLPRQIGWLGDGSVRFVYQNARWKIAVA